MNPPNLPPTLPPNTPYKILRLYLKDASVEVTQKADQPRQAISPDIGVDMPNANASGTGLASLAVAAGFQPMLLDHVDFDVMLTHAPVPMRLDVIAAKPTLLRPLSRRKR